MTLPCLALGRGLLLNGEQELALVGEFEDGRLLIKNDQSEEISTSVNIVWQE